MFSPLKKYIYISLALHLVISIALLILTSNNNIKQPFIVFGAYSKKPSHTVYKVREKIVPFTPHSSKSSLGHGKPQKSQRAIKRTYTNKKLVVNKKTTQTTKKVPSPKSAPPKNNKPQKAVTVDTKIQKKLIEKKFKEELKKMEIEAQKAIEKEDARKKELEQKIKRTKPKPETKQEPAPEPEIKQEPTPDPEVEEVADTLVAETETPEEFQEEFVFSLSGTVDKKFELYQKCLQQEVQRLWAPPLGVPKGTTCRIKFVIDKDGKVTNFENIKKSNVLIYDLSILRIAHRFKFDKCLWGKSFTIDFCQ
jgi:hypothetical protein